MARTRNETEFARMLGQAGELLAPDLLNRLSITDIENLNQIHMNHPWADFAGRLNGEWVLVAVRTRLNWRKPLPPGVARTSYGFNGAGPRKAKLAADMFRSSRGLDESTPIRLLWLAIAIDLDNTYEAYWGDVSEMRLIPRKTGDHGLRIRMAAEDRAKYVGEGRRLARREPVEIHWDKFPDEWAFAAREQYLRLDAIENRELRVEEAVRTCPPPAGPRSRTAHEAAIPPARLTRGSSEADVATSPAARVTGGQATPSAPGTNFVVEVEPDRPEKIESTSKAPRTVLIAVVNAYNLKAELGLRVRDGKNPAYRQIVPPGWETSRLHYEFYQACGRIGAELHLAFRREPLKVVSIAEFLKPFAGRAVANGERELTWCQERHSGNGCLAASFPLSSSPEAVAAAMRDLISMTRSGVSEYLTKPGLGVALE